MRIKVTCKEHNIEAGGYPAFFGNGKIFGAGTWELDLSEMYCIRCADEDKPAEFEVWTIA
jgi:hypothetical protein